MPTTTAGGRARQARRAATLKQAPAGTKKVAGYLRLTVDPNGDKIGYDTQRKKIEEWARARNFEVVWFQDKDLTAADARVKRPQYEEMLSRASEGEFAGIIVWRLDRLVRLTREFHRCLDAVKSRGAFLVSALEGLDTSQPGGEMIMNLLSILAEIEVNAMRIRALTHQQHRSENGLLSGVGLRPFGFVGVKKDPETKVILNKGEALIKHDLREARLLREAARRIAHEGASYPEVVSEWAARKPPVVGTQGQSFEISKLKTILTSARVAGLREYNVYDDEGELVEVAYAKAEWKPIIDRETWDLLRDRARPYAPRDTKRGHLFTGGIAQCGRCGRPMVGGGTQKTGTKEMVGNYRCNTSVKARSQGSCGSVEVQSEYLDKAVLAMLFERLKASPELHDLVNSTDTDVVDERAELMQEIQECDGRLRDLGRVSELGTSHPDYRLPAEVEGARAGLRERRMEADRRLRSIKVAEEIPTPNEEERRDVRAWFAKMSVGEKRSWLAAHVTGVIVAPAAKRSRYFDPSRVTPLFADPKKSRRSGQ